MHISDLHEYGLNEEAEKVAQPFLNASRKKALIGEIRVIVDSEFDRLEEYAGEFISQTAASRAEKFLERVLRGDEDAAMSLLGDKSGYDRVRNSGPWASLIHGRVFETNGIKLRRKIVEAHSDLLVSERIKDLESIVDGLKGQILKLERIIEER